MPIREIHLLHHTHVDVGYTDLAPVITRKHAAYLDQVLDYCAATDDYPEDARFRWVNEFSWPVVEFLRQRPERADELFQRHREGRLELTALFLDPTDLMDRRAYEMALQPALRLGREQGFAVTTAMIVDVPGQTWSLPDILSAHGVKYFSTCPNAMVSKPILVPPPFWWVGPDGGRVLTWQTDWRQGWYGAGHVLGFPQGFAVAWERTLEYLRRLESEGYPYEVLCLHYAADNYPPSATVSDLVREWNDQGDLPRLRLSTNAEFFGRMVAVHGEDFPEYRLAWPDWWTEGLGSAAYESGLARETHCRMQRIEGLLAKLGEERDLWPLWEELLLFDEHTWGCSNMATDPYGFQSRASWCYKSAHIYTAHDQARRLEAELAAQLAANQPQRETADFRDATVVEKTIEAAPLTLTNASDHDWEGPVALPESALAGNVVFAGAAQLPVSVTPATAAVPRRAWAQVKVPAGATVTLLPGRADDLVAPGGPLPGVLESPFYRLEYDDRGRVTRLLDRETGLEMLDARAPWGLAETIHERITSTEDRAAIWERGYTTLPYGQRRTDASFARTGALAGARVVQTYRGALCQGVIWHSTLPDVELLETELRLWHGSKRLDVEVRLRKAAQPRYESLYVAFPFRLDNPRGFAHHGGAVFEVEREQLPGTCRDYHAVEHFAALQGDQGWAVVTPTEAPLVQFGQLNFGQWSDKLRLSRGCLYSWLLNNFWYTNFPGYQLGDLSFCFALTTGTGDLDRAAATEFGRQVRVGLTVI